ncbi:MAG: thioredoxin [Lachnospiraceae bacterium]|nr:thioredoxin [Lachnospiraceae bacterium]
MAALALTGNNFEETIKNADVALVDFWAAWCGPCQMQGPVVEELAEKRKDVVVGKVDVEKESDLTVKFQVSNIPALVFFKNGEMVKKVIGFHNLEEIEEILNNL